MDLAINTDVFQLYFGEKITYWVYKVETTSDWKVFGTFDGI